MHRTSMENKINMRLFFMGVMGMALTAVIILLFFRSTFYAQAEANIEQIVDVISMTYEQQNGQIDLRVYESEEYRLTLIAPNGEVLFESKGDPLLMEDHSTRREVMDAIKNGSAQCTRHSSTMGVDTYYAAVRLSDGNILRIAQAVDAMWNMYDKAIPVIGVVVIVILLVSILLSYLLTRQLITPIIRMGSDLENIDENIPYPELEPFADSLKEYQLRERQNEKQRKEFTANVSHELKTPLTSISGYAEMLEYGMCRPEDVKTFGGRIHAEAARLITLVGDIIRLTQMDEADAPPNLEKIDLAHVAAAAADRLDLQAEKAEVTLMARGESARMMGNARMLEEMVYNLCDNAIRYNTSGGHVWLTTGVDIRNRAYIEVKDDGIGIPESHQSRIFERFYRVDKSHSRATGGTGLGLAIVKHAASLLGGEITLESKEGIGTTITVWFPAAE
ncbi:MAG: two-component sensor histidine kinase [Clostridia bacterium]|nr:two-component sensor histidine kinase [Clostridia bacterium]